MSIAVMKDDEHGMPAVETGRRTLCTKAISLSFLFHIALAISLVILSRQKNQIKPPFVVHFDLAIAAAITENSVESASSRNIPATTLTVQSSPSRPAEPLHRQNASLIKTADQPQTVTQHVKRVAEQKTVSIVKNREAKRNPTKISPQVNHKSKQDASAINQETSLHAEITRSEESRQNHGRQNMALTKQSAPTRENGVKQYLQNNFGYIRELILQNLTFPTAAKKMGWKGKVLVKFTIKQDGEVDGIAILASSGHDELDSNVIMAIRRTAPFPKPPLEALLILPITYSLH